jgi:hypothetical protein
VGECASGVDAFAQARKALRGERSVPVGRDRFVRTNGTACSVVDHSSMAYAKVHPNERASTFGGSI